MSNVREGSTFEKAHIEEKPECPLWMCTEIQQNKHGKSLALVTKLKLKFSCL